MVFLEIQVEIDFPASPLKTVTEPIIRCGLLLKPVNLYESKKKKRQWPGFQTDSNKCYVENQSSPKEKPKANPRNMHDEKNLLKNFTHLVNSTEAFWSRGRSCS